MPLFLSWSNFWLWSLTRISSFTHQTGGLWRLALLEQVDETLPAPVIIWTILTGVSLLPWLPNLMVFPQVQCERQGKLSQKAMVRSTDVI